MMQQSVQIKFFEDNFNLVQGLNQQLESENKHFSDYHQMSQGPVNDKQSFASLKSGGGLNLARDDGLRINFECLSDESQVLSIEGTSKSKHTVNNWTHSEPDD
jgi:hypothetical protein